jgi:hypothetical protein
MAGSRAAGVDVNQGAVQLVFAVAASGPSLAALVAWLVTGRRRLRSGVRLTPWGPVVALLVGAAPPVLAAVWVTGGDLAVLGHHAPAVGVLVTSQR